MPSHAIDKQGNAYRSFKLVYVEQQEGCPIEKQLHSHSAVNRARKNANAQQLASIGPQRAARKIFTRWCRANGCSDRHMAFRIMETTRGGAAKVYAYTGCRTSKSTSSTVGYRTVEHGGSERSGSIVTHGFVTVVVPFKKRT